MHRLLPALLAASLGTSACRETAPRNPADLAHAIEMIAREDCAAAEPELQQLLELHQGDPAELHHYLGVCRQGAGDLPAAETHYREALRRNPGLFESLNNLGVVVGELGRGEESLNILTTLTQAFPEEAMGFFNLGFQQQTLGDLEGALASFRRAAELDTCGVEALLLAADLLQQQGRSAEALETLQEASRRLPGDAITALSLASLLDGAGRGEEAIAVLIAAGASPENDARGTAAVAVALRDRGRNDEALAAARNALSRSEQDAEVSIATLTLARIARQAGRNDEAESTLRAGARRLPADAEIALYLGGLLTEAARCTEALPFLQLAWQQFSKDGPQTPKAAAAADALRTCGAAPTP